jgi:hypothetical protein
MKNIISILFIIFASCGGANAATQASQVLNDSSVSGSSVASALNALGTTGPNAAFNAANLWGATSAGIARQIPFYLLQNTANFEMSADFATTANLSYPFSTTFPQSIDGTNNIQPGFTVLFKNQTTQSQNGLWIAGNPWTRHPSLPSGAQIGQYCDVPIHVLNGDTNIGRIYQLATSSGALTIGTNNLSFVDRTPYAKNVTSPSAINRPGLVYVSNGNNTSSTPVPLVSPLPTSVSDCTSFQDLTGGIGDTGDYNGNLGPCIVGDAGGWATLMTHGGVPTVTRGTMDTNATDQTFTVTSLSSASSVGITYSSAKKQVQAPVCIAQTNSSTAAYQSSNKGSSSNWTGVVISFASAFTGTVRALCF